MAAYQEVGQGVYRIAGSRSNIYLVAGQSLSLIDTGMPGDDAAVLQALRSLGHEPRDVRTIFITHGHLDHVGSLAALKAATGARVVAGAADTEHIEGRRMLCSMPREGAGGKVFKCVLFVLEKFIQKYVPVQVDISCAGDVGPASIEGIEIIPTPGHSAGSLSFYRAPARALFTGDALTGAPAPGLPLRAGCSDYGRALQSVCRLAQVDAALCLFGHGEPLTAGAADTLRSLAGSAALLAKR